MVHASEHGDEAVLEAFEAAYTPVLEGMLGSRAAASPSMPSPRNPPSWSTARWPTSGPWPRSTFTVKRTTAPASSTLASAVEGQDGVLLPTWRRFLQYATVTLPTTAGSGQADRCSTCSVDHRLRAKRGVDPQRIGPEAPEVVFYSFIKLPEGKMSTRRGNVVFMDDLLEEAKAQAAGGARPSSGVRRGAD